MIGVESHRQTSADNRNEFLTRSALKEKNPETHRIALQMGGSLNLW
jgi:hypothetical protein